MPAGHVMTPGYRPPYRKPERKPLPRQYGTIGSGTCQDIMKQLFSIVYYTLHCVFIFNFVLSLVLIVVIIIVVIRAMFPVAILYDTHYDQPGYAYYYTARKKEKMRIGDSFDQIIICFLNLGARGLP